MNKTYTEKDVGELVIVDLVKKMESTPKNLPMAADNSFQESQHELEFDQNPEFEINRQVSQEKVFLLNGSKR